MELIFLFVIILLITIILVAVIPRKEPKYTRPSEPQQADWASLFFFFIIADRLFSPHDTSDERPLYPYFHTDHRDSFEFDNDYDIYDNDNNYDNYDNYDDGGYYDFF